MHYMARAGVTPIALVNGFCKHQEKSNLDRRNDCSFLVCETMGCTYLTCCGRWLVLCLAAPSPTHVGDQPSGSCRYAGTDYAFTLVQPLRQRGK